MDEFLQNRPSLNDLATRNIIHTEYIEYDYNDARNIQLQKQQNIITALNNKLDESRRPTITDLGDMHIIPHDYLDRLLEEAVANHRRGSYYNRIYDRDRLQHHLPSPIAAALAETLLASYTDSDENDYDDYKLDLKIKQIEFDLNELKLLQNDIKYVVYGYVRNVQHFLFAEYENNPYYTISELIVQMILFYYHYNNALIYEPFYSFFPMDPVHKDQVINKLERRLSHRPSTQQIETMRVVPPNYFQGPETSLLREALRREIVLDTLEGFMPKRKDIYNLVDGGILKPDFLLFDYDEAVQLQQQRKQRVMDELDNKLDPNKRSYYKLKKQIEELEEELNENDRRISTLSNKNTDLKEHVSLMKVTENKHLVKISLLEDKALKIDDQQNELHRLREEQHSNELHKLDSKALEIELSKQRLNTQKLSDDKRKLEDELLEKKYKIGEMEETLQRFVKEKIELIQKTNQQMNELRDYLCYYQKYIAKQQNKYG